MRIRDLIEINAYGTKAGYKAAQKTKTDGPTDHMAEYHRLMQESAAHQRAADALNQSHEDADYPLYKQHAKKAWKLGNQAMEHFGKLTKEQRSMMEDQHWQQSGQQVQQQQQQGFGRQRQQGFGRQQQQGGNKQYIQSIAAYATTRGIEAAWSKAKR